MSEFVNLNDTDDSLDIPTVLNLVTPETQILEVQEYPSESNLFSIDTITSTDDLLDIIPYNPTALNIVTPETQILDGRITSLDVPEYPSDPNLFSIDIITPTEESSVEPINIKECCDVSDYYGDTNPDGSFKKENLFSELISEYQRAVVRKNLGIADEYSLVWGFISGNILNQKDLYNFVKDSTAETVNDLIEEINLKLAQWAYDISTSLSDKANINSPNFTGTPTTTTPNFTDSSNRIPTTEWVSSKINELWIGSLKWFVFNVNYIFLGESLSTLVASWEYNEPIESQSINGIPLDITDRTYTFTNVASNRTATLSYVVDGIEFTKSILFEVITPLYFGTQLSYQNITKTKDKSFILDCGNSNFGYIYIPNETNSRIAVDNIVGGFTNIGNIIISGVTYYIYKTFNSGLGKLYITIL